MKITTKNANNVINLALHVYLPLSALLVKMTLPEITTALAYQADTKMDPIVQYAIILVIPVVKQNIIVMEIVLTLIGKVMIVYVKLVILIMERKFVKNVNTHAKIVLL